MQKDHGLSDPAHHRCTYLISASQLPQKNVHAGSKRHVLQSVSSHVFLVGTNIGGTALSASCSTLAPLSLLA